MMKQDWNHILGTGDTPMTEFLTWRIDSPEDVDAFERETRESHDRAGRVIYLDHTPAVMGLSRQGLLERAKARAEHGESFEIFSALDRLGERITSLEFWMLTPSGHSGELELLDDSPPVQFHTTPE